MSKYKKMKIYYPSQKRQNQSYKFYKIAKSSNLEILQETLHIYLLKLLDKMYK